MPRSRRLSSSLFATCLIGSAFSPALAFAQTATIQEVGWFEDENPASQAFGISGDGTVVVGESVAPDGDHNAFRWTAAGGIVNLGTIGNVENFSYANAANADGSVVVGRSMTQFDGSRAYRWTQSGGMAELGTIGDVGGQSNALGVSSNGTVIVGNSPSPTSGGQFHAFRWTSGDGMQDLGTIGGVFGGSFASGVSADGSVVVGYSKSPGGDNRAFRWTAVGGMQNLGTIGDAGGNSYATAVSADGSVVVGESVSPGGDYHAFRWTAGSMQDLGTVGNAAGRSLANGVSADGSVVVGETFQGACVWIDGKPHLLLDLLEGYGADPVNAGWTSLHSISGCSADGTTLSGNGEYIGPRIGFHARIFIDRTKPTIVPEPRVSEFCDRGKTFATIRLPKPDATDNAPGKITVSHNAGTRFPIGTTKVVWTATDVAGNKARWTQTVKVVNRDPKANAGANVAVTTTSENGARVTLDGSKSSDPDQHELTFEWSAAGVKLAKSARPSAVFPVGRKTVKLTVTDAGGADATDTVQVTVTLRNGTARPRGAQANAAFAAAAENARDAIASGSGGFETSRALVYTNAADVLGDATGGFVRWEEGGSETDAGIDYAAGRALQQQYGAAAAAALIAAYAETGDETLLPAIEQAAWGTAFADADLTDR